MVKKMKRTFSFADAQPKRYNLISNPCAACNTFAGYFSSCLRFNISIPKNCSASPAKELQRPSTLNHTCCQSGTRQVHFIFPGFNCFLRYGKNKKNFPFALAMPIMYSSRTVSPIVVNFLFAYENLRKKKFAAHHNKCTALPALSFNKRLRRKTTLAALSTLNPSHQANNELI